MISKAAIAGVVLAGGRASRMRHLDKPLLLLNGKPLIDYIVELAAPQVAELLISVNHNASAYSYFSLPLIGDRVKIYGGPLVGIYSAMCWLEEKVPVNNFSHIACFPGDVPSFPTNIVKTLALAIEQAGAEVALCRTGGQLQPLFSLWSLATKEIIVEAISDNLCGPKLILPRLDTVVVPIENNFPADFANVNTPEQLVALEQQYTNGD